MPRWLSLSLKFVLSWLLATIVYVALKVGYDLAFRNYVDLRKLTIVEYVVLPVGLALAYWSARWAERWWERRAGAG